MPLQKRKATGEYEDWKPRGASVSLPLPVHVNESPAKKRRVVTAPSAQPPHTSSSHTANSQDWFIDPSNGYQGARLWPPAAVGTTSVGSVETPSPTMTNASSTVARVNATPATRVLPSTSVASTTRASSSVTPTPSANDSWFADASNGYTRLTQPPQQSQSRTHTLTASSSSVSTHTLPASTSSSSTPVAPGKGKGKETPAPPKSPKKSKEKPEKRAARVKTSCPANIRDRVGRVANSTFYMIGRERTPGELEETFQVTGSTFNLYTVKIGKVPSCTCPDAAKGNHCKHILFVFLKVLHVPQTSNTWYQKALLSTELEEIFRAAPVAPNAVSHPHLQAALDRTRGKSTTQTSRDKKRIPEKGDDCPVCYEDMGGAREADLTFCKECGNAIHGACFTQWKTSSAQTGKRLTCVYCRAAWPDAGAGPTGAALGAGVRRTTSGYLNLAGVMGASPTRDTSTYYQGPRRGQRYMGYIGYDDDEFD